MSSSNASTYDAPVAVGQISLTATPSVVVFNNELVFTAQSPSGAQLGYALTTPGGNWGFMYAAMPPNSVQPTYMSASPGMAVFNGSLYCFTQEVDNGSNLNYSTFDGSSWSTQQTVGDANMGYAPGPVVFNNNLYVFFDGGGWLYYYVSSDGTSWGNTVNVVHTGLSYNPAPVVYNDTLYVFYTAEGQEHSIWFNAMNTQGGWTGSTEIPGLNNNSIAYSSYNGACPPCAIVFNGELYLFYITSGWTVAYRKFNGGNSWDNPIGLYNPVDFTNQNSLSNYACSTTGNLTAVTYNAPNGDPTLAVYFTGYNTNNLYYMSTTDPSSGGNWSAPVQAGTPLPQGVSPPGTVATDVTWTVAFYTSQPGAWYTLS
jgi:hypothetical protein